MFEINMVLIFVSATADADEESVNEDFYLSEVKEAKADYILFSEAEEEYNSNITPTKLQYLEADATMLPKSARKKSISPKKSDDDGVSAVVTHTSWLTM